MRLGSGMSDVQGWTCPTLRLFGCLPLYWIRNLVAHGDELFRSRRMKPDGAIKLTLGSAAIHRDGETLDDFRRIRPEHVSTHDTVALVVHHKLHHGSFVPAAERILHGPKNALVDIRLAADLARL